MPRHALTALVALLFLATIATPVAAADHDTKAPAARMVDAGTLDQLTTAEDFYQNYATVLRLYKAFFDRDPDIEGAKYWIYIYRRGADVSEIADQFARGAEFQNTYGQTSNAQFLDTVYGNVLDRGSDEAGTAYWLERLDSGALTRGGVVRWIAANEEFVNANRFPGEETAKPGADRAQEVTGISSFVGTRDFRNYSSSSTTAWSRYTDSDLVWIPATIDGSSQAAYWAPADGANRPLLVVLHSWSSNYNQQLNIPFARWADQNDWAMIAPDFRGANNRPVATGSDYVISDIKDAVNYALANDDINADKVFMIGFSGGAFAVLNMAGEAPELFAGGVAWVPVYDLVEWYAYRLTQPRRHYVGQLENSCGGAPHPGTAAGDECYRRSPSSSIANAKASNISLYIATGLQDTLVPTSQSFKAFDDLARPEDQFGQAVYDAVDRGVLPAELWGENDGNAWFDAQDKPLLMSRTSGNVTLNVFTGVHESLYEPGLEWMAKTAWIADR